jgi:lambda family phage portal protein
MATMIRDASGRKVRAAKYTPHYSGATIEKRNFDFQPPHRSGNSAVRDSWDLLVRRLRWAIENTYMLRRAVDLMTQLVVGQGLNVFYAGLPELRAGADPGAIVDDPLFRFGDEADRQFERWAQEYADSERRRTWYEMQTTSAKDLFGTGNSLWLKVVRPAPAGISPVCWQLLEFEQLDTSRTEESRDGKNRIDQGIEYNEYGEAVAYYLYDAHPYDDYAGSWYGGGRFSAFEARRVPASRVVHLALTTRASQSVGVGIGNILLQPSHDEDWLTGHELTGAALAAGLTILIRESENDDGSLNFDTGGNEVSEPAAYGDNDGEGVPHISEVGLTAGTVARVRGTEENVEVVESKRPNKDIEPFARFLMNRASMAANLSYHRYTGNPSGASFATLRAMINDDRSFTEPVTDALGIRIGKRCRKVHDGTQAALGRFRTVTAAEYGRDLATYQDWDVLGPPIRHLNPMEDVQAAAARIRCGLSTLRRECGLLGLNYRAVMRQLAVEGSLSRALGVVLDFGSGGGGAPSQTTTTEAGGGE